MVKGAVERKELLRARDEIAKERCMKVYKKEKRKIKRFINQSKKDMNEQCGSKMKWYVDGNRKLVWKEVSK